MNIMNPRFCPQTSKVRNLDYFIFMGSSTFFRCQRRASAFSLADSLVFSSFSFVGLKYIHDLCRCEQKDFVGATPGKKGKREEYLR